MKDIYKILVITSTFPKNEVDPVPTFVKEQIISLKNKYPFIDFHVLAPSTKGKIPYAEYVNYKETRFRYFINKFEILNTYGLISSIKRNKFLIFLLPLYLISLIYSSIKVCLKFKPDLVYVHWVTPQAIIALLLKKLFRVNYVFSTHSNDALILTKFIGGTALLNSVVKNSHAYISDSKAIESNLKKHIKETIKNKIKHLTLYAFSTENWKRPKKEINYLFSLLENFLKNRIKDLNNKNIKLFVIGKKKFSIKLNNLLKLAEKQTETNDTLQLNLALNYGSKSEIINSIKMLKKNKSRISEKSISNNLYTKNIPDPDILIRTGNTKRLSNFLLWQCAYTEIFFEKKLWPDFNQNDFNKIVKKFINIKRNFGSI